MRLDTAVAPIEEKFTAALLAAGPVMGAITTALWAEYDGFWSVAAKFFVPLVFVTHAAGLMWIVHLAQVDQTDDGTALPTRFRAVLFLDVFGWLHGQDGEKRGQRGGNLRRSTSDADSAWQVRNARPLKANVWESLKEALYGVLGWLKEGDSSTSRPHRGIIHGVGRNAAVATPHAFLASTFYAHPSSPNDAHVQLEAESSVKRGTRPWHLFRTLLAVIILMWVTGVVWACGEWAGVPDVNVIPFRAVEMEIVLSGYMAANNSGLSGPVVKQSMHRRRAVFHHRRRGVSAVQQVHQSEAEYAPLAHGRVVPAVWPRTIEDPRTVSCNGPGGVMLAADNDSIFLAPMASQGPVRFEEINCGQLDAGIRDIALRCSPNSTTECEVVVLHGDNRTITMCDVRRQRFRSGRLVGEWPDEELPEGIAFGPMYPEGIATTPSVIAALIKSHGDKVVFVPAQAIRTFDGGVHQAGVAVGSKVIVAAIGRAIVGIGADGEILGRWARPPDVLGSLAICGPDLLLARRGKHGNVQLMLFPLPDEILHPKEIEEA